MANPPKEEKCCICQEENFMLPIQSNCSHWFCGGCFLELWDRRPAFEFKPCKCPLDSGFITSLRPTELALFQQRRLALVGQQRSQVLEFIGYYNSLFDEGSFRFMQLLRGFPLLRQRLEKAQGLRRPISCLLWAEVFAYWLWRFPFLDRRLTMERRPLPPLFWADVIVHVSPIRSSNYSLQFSANNEQFVNSCELLDTGRNTHFHRNLRGNVEQISTSRT